MKRGKPLQRKTPLRRSQKPLKRKTRLKKRSKRRVVEERQYQQARTEYMLAHPVCEKCACKMSVQLHHKKGRNNSRLYDFRFFMATCDPCHKYIHANPTISYERGWLIKDEKINPLDK